MSGCLTGQCLVLPLQGSPGRSWPSAFAYTVTNQLAGSVKNSTGILPIMSLSLKVKVGRSDIIMLLSLPRVSLSKYSGFLQLFFLNKLYYFLPKSFTSLATFTPMYHIFLSEIVNGTFLKTKFSKFSCC